MRARGVNAPRGARRKTTEWNSRQQILRLCSIRDDLVEAVARVLERPVEASGVVDPAGIAATCRCRVAPRPFHRVS
jgi:hypothetical protein